MPNTLSGAPQLFYLQTVAPDGTQLDLQFFAKARQAAAERVDAKRRLHVSNATTVRDAFVLAARARRLPPRDVAALTRLLPRG